MLHILGIKNATYVAHWMCQCQWWSSELGGSSVHCGDVTLLSCPSCPPRPTCVHPALLASPAPWCANIGNIEMSQVYYCIRECFFQLRTLEDDAGWKYSRPTTSIRRPKQQCQRQHQQHTRQQRQQQPEGETGDKQRVAVVDRGEAHLVPPKTIQGISDPPTVINTWIM